MTKKIEADELTEVPVRGHQRAAWRKLVKPIEWNLASRDEVYEMMSSALYAVFMGHMEPKEAELVRRFADCALKHNPVVAKPSGEVEEILKKLAEVQPAEVVEVDVKLVAAVGDPENPEVV